ncbi:MAG: alpha-1,6-glucosidase domain-containing protein [Luteimonas sp.]
MPQSRTPFRAEYAAAAAASHSAPPGRAAGRAGNVFIAVLSAALIGAAALLAPPPAASAVPGACDAPAHATVLHPAARAAADARGYWLDRGLLRWPGVAAGASGRFRLYHSARAAITAPVGEQVASADDVIKLAIPDRVPAVLVERFAFADAGIELAVSNRDQAALPGLLRGQVLLVHEDDQGQVLDATHLQLPGALDDWYAAAVDAPALGPSLEDHASVLRVWAPTAREVSVCLYDSADGPAASHLRLFRDATTGVWSRHVDDDLSGRYYAYLVDLYVPGAGIVRNRVTDPYSLALSADSVRSWFADLDAAALKPGGWDHAPRPAPLAAQVDMTIYELHVRDFSRGDASVPPEHRGKYLAFGEHGSHGMRHLRALAGAGLTDVHLLPVFDLATVPEVGCIEPQVPDDAPDSQAQQAAVMAQAARDCFNWGYDPYHFNAPEGSFASDARDPATRIREFRAMVQALHREGLRVGMDVVYNHTTASGQAHKSVLDRIVPGYYHRLDKDGVVERSTCCDNTATEHAMMARLMIDSAELWVRHYRIDSFRFDLMGHQPRAAMERLQARVNVAAGRHVELIGEGWNFGEVVDGKRFVQASQLSLPGSGIATFRDRARDAIRGGGPADRGADLFVQGYVNGLHYAPNATMSAAQAALEAIEGQDVSSRGDLLHAADLVRAGLAGTLADYRMVMADGAEKPLSRLDYKGQPAGYATQPSEVVNYVENHDNQTLFDINVFKLPGDTPPAERARVQVLAFALNAFSQGIAYFHAGGELLRSKSLDRNSYDSGDWFNRVDWTARENFFGTGLPPAQDNREDWDLMRPLLADASIRPAPADIAFTRDAFLALLRIRASTTLLRLRSADDIHQRLRFHNSGPEQNPVVVAGEIDGRGYDGAAFDALLYLVNVSPAPQTLEIAAAADRPWTLHPVQRSDAAADPRPREQARFDRASGRFEIPPRTAVVYVIERTAYR